MYYNIVARAFSVLLKIFDGNKKAKSIILWPLATRLLKFNKMVVDIGDNIKMNVYSDMRDMVNKNLLFYSRYLNYAWEPITARTFKIILSLKNEGAVVKDHLLRVGCLRKGI